MTSQRLGEIALALVRARKMGAKLTGKSSFEKELTAWLERPPILLPARDEWKIDAPPRYEEEMKLSQ